MAKFIERNSLLFRDKEILQFLEESIDVAKNLEVGTYDKLILNNDIFSIPQNTYLKESADCVFESHKEYIDIHVIINGTENIELLHTNDNHQIYEKNTNNDYYLYTSNINAKKTVLNEKMLAIFFFEDIHKVGIVSNSNNNHIVKVVLKIKKNLFEKEISYV